MFDNYCIKDYNCFMTIIKVIKGTKDILPQDVGAWQRLEEKALEVFSNYGYKEIRTPIFEAT